MSDFQRQINQRIEAFVDEITDLARHHAIDTLSRALESRGRAPASNGVHIRARSGKRSPSEVSRDADKLYAYLQENPGLRAEEIATSVGMSTKELALPMRKLIRAKSIRTEGQKRATRYFPLRAKRQRAAGVAKRRKRK